MPTLKSLSSGKTLTLDSSSPVHFVQSGDGLIAVNEASKDSIGTLHHAKRDMVLVAGTGKRIFVNGCVVTLFKIIREGDVIRLGEEDWTFHEIVKEVLDSSSALVKQKKQCLVCRSQFKPGDTVVYCPKCNTPHHESCWIDQNGRCANGKACNYQAPLVENKV